MINIAKLYMDVDSTRVRRARDEMNGLGKDARQTEREVAGSTSSMGRAFGGLVGPLLAAASAVVSLGTAVRAVNQFTEMNNKLMVLTGSQEAATRSLDALAEVARRTRTPLESLVTLYQRGSLAAKELGASEQQLMRFTENVALALAQQGGSASSASGALLQLSQALGAGTVRAEEFNSILEGAFPLALAAARGIDAAGGSVAKLRTMVIEGDISSKQFFAAILSQTDELQKAFGRTSPTIAQAFQVLADQSTLALGKLDQATGISAAFAGSIMDISSAINDNTAPAIAFLTENAERLEFWVTGGAAAFLLMTVRVGHLATAFRLLRGALISTGLFAIAVVVGEIVYQFDRLAQATGSYASAFSMLVAVMEELVDRIGMAFVGLGLMIDETMYGIAIGIRNTFSSSLSSIADAIEGFSQEMAAPLRSAVIDIDIGTSRIQSKVAGINREFEDMDKRFSAPLASIDAIIAKLEEVKTVARDIKPPPVLPDPPGPPKLADIIPGSDGKGKKKKGKEKSPYGKYDHLGFGDGVGGLPPPPDWFDKLAESADHFADSASRAFMSFATGASSAGDAAKSLLGSLIQMAANQAFTAIIGSATGGTGLAGALFGLFANGGAFQGGDLVPFSNGGAVVSRPTMFPMSRGRTGLMGEAGPEAIMPLKRASNGRLGVAAEGGGGTLKVVIEEGPAFASRVRTEAQGVAVKVVRQGIQQYDKQVAPKTVARVQNDPRRIG